MSLFALDKNRVVWIALDEIKWVWLGQFWIGYNQIRLDQITTGLHFQMSTKMLLSIK